MQSNTGIPPSFRNGTSKDHHISRNQDLELNADLPERFRGKPRPGRYTAAPELDGLKIELNTAIREYVYEADKQQQMTELEWQQLPEIPTAEEIAINSTDDVQIPANKIDKRWKSKEKYLWTHYCLMREDAIGPLRDAVQIFRNDPDQVEKNQDIGIYEKVHVKGVTFAHFGVAVRISFSISRVGKGIRWKSSSRLKAGSLVALTPAHDGFRKTCVLALVAARPLAGLEVTPPELDLYFTKDEEIEIDPQIEWTMLEARQGYFEAHRHTLKALQKLGSET